MAGPRSRTEAAVVTRSRKEGHRQAQGRRREHTWPRTPWGLREVLSLADCILNTKCYSRSFSSVLSPIEGCRFWDYPHSREGESEVHGGGD